MIARQNSNNKVGNTYTCFIIPPLITAETLRMNERALVAMSSVLPPPKKGEMVTVQLRFIVDGLPNENNEYVEWVLVALDGGLQLACRRDEKFIIWRKAPHELDSCWMMTILRDGVVNF